MGRAVEADPLGLDLVDPRVPGQVLGEEYAQDLQPRDAAERLDDVGAEVGERVVVGDLGQAERGSVRAVPARELVAPQEHVARLVGRGAEPRPRRAGRRASPGTASPAGFRAAALSCSGETASGGVARAFRCGRPRTR
jgi:hypothetical protein